MLPSFFDVRQNFPSRKLPDLAQAITEALESVSFSKVIRPGQSVAVAVGSRGIAQIDRVVANVIAQLIELQAEPFVVPAMGSHGGASAEGQIDVLAKLGVTEASVGCPIRSSMETVHLGDTDGGIPLHFDANAASAHHVVLINRIKPHTRLTGTLQSGLCKMLMIGLGKHVGAASFHHAFSQFDYQLDRVAPEIVRRIIEAMPISFGLAIIEDAHDEVAAVEAIAAENFLTREPALLATATEWMPRLPFDQIDLLIVDQIGKEISGTGMDTNIIGRKANDRAAMPDEYPKVNEIYVRSLTEKTAGNGTGIGIAEYCHRQLANQLDEQKVRVNCLTSGHASAGAIPLIFDSDREALQAARSQFGGSEAEIRWVRIKDTLHLSEFSCSQAFSAATQNDENLEAISPLRPLEFDERGDLTRSAI